MELTDGAVAGAKIPTSRPAGSAMTGTVRSMPTGADRSRRSDLAVLGGPKARLVGRSPNGQLFELRAVPTWKIVRAPNAYSWWNPLWQCKNLVARIRLLSNLGTGEWKVVVLACDGDPFVIARRKVSEVGPFANETLAEDALISTADRMGLTRP